MVELWMLLYLIASLAIGLHGVNKYVYRDWMLAALWGTFSFFSAMFLAGVAGSVSADNIIISRLQDFFYSLLA